MRNILYPSCGMNRRLPVRCASRTQTGWNDRWSGRVRYEANDSGFGGEAAATPGAFATESVPGTPARRNFDSLSCWHTNVTMAVYIDV